MELGKLSAVKQIAAYLFRGVTLLIATSIVCFVLVTLSPVDPIAAYRQSNPGVSEESVARMQQFWGVDDPPVERYFRWASSLMQGDFGDSKIYRRPVLEVIGARVSATLALMLVAWTLSGLLGLCLGCVMGIQNGRLLDRILKRACLIMCSIPTFWLGLVFLMVFSVWLGWFPFGMASPIGVALADATLAERLHHLVLPALTLSFLSCANVALHTREKLTDVLNSDYVLFARARGESRFSILLRHGLRNILLPVITLQFSSFAELFGGSVIAENIFSFPGLGAAASAAGLQGDMPLLLGITLFSTLFVFTGNALANVLCTIIDPRSIDSGSLGLPGVGSGSGGGSGGTGSVGTRGAGGAGGARGTRGDGTGSARGVSLESSGSASQVLKAHEVP